METLYLGGKKPGQDSGTHLGPREEGDNRVIKLDVDCPSPPVAVGAIGIVLPHPERRAATHVDILRTWSEAVREWEGLSGASSKANLH